MQFAKLTRPARIKPD